MQRAGGFVKLHCVRRETGGGPRVGVAVAGIAAGVLSVVGQSLMLLWAAPRGFELADESYWLLVISRPERHRVTTTSFGTMWHPFYEAMDHSVPALRVARLVVSLAVSALLAWSLWGHLRPDRRVATRLLWVVAIFQISFLAWTWAPQSPGYDSTTAFLALLLVSGVLSFARPGDRSPAWLAGWALWCGLVVPFLMLAKWTGAGLIGVAALACMLSMRRQRHLATFAAFAAGVAAALVFVHLAVVPLGEFARGSMKASGVYSISTHSLPALAGTYLRSLVATSGKAVLLLAPVALVSWGARRWWLGRRGIELGRPLDDAPLVWGFVVAGGAVMAVWGSFEGSALHIAKLCAVVLVLLVLLIVEVGRRWTDDAAQRRTLALPAFLMVLPLLCSAGTNNPILFPALYSVGCWVCATAILTQDTVHAGWRRLAGGWLTVALIGAPLAVYGGVVARPFALPRDLRHQDVALHGDRLEGLQVDDDTARVIRELLDLVPRESDPVVLALDGQVFVNFAADLPSAGMAYYTVSLSAEEGAAEVRLGCEEVPLAERRVVLIHSIEEMPPEVVRELAACGLDYPAGFDRVDIEPLRRWETIRDPEPIHIETRR